jgi:hypothetical protein
MPSASSRRLRRGHRQLATTAVRGSASPFGPRLPDRPGHGRAAFWIGRTSLGFQPRGRGREMASVLGCCPSPAGASGNAPPAFGGWVLVARPLQSMRDSAEYFGFASPERPFSSARRTSRATMFRGEAACRSRGLWCARRSRTVGFALSDWRAGYLAQYSNRWLPVMS